MLDLSDEIETLKPQLLKAFEDVLDGGAFIMGPNVKAFEQECASYLGTKHAIALNSGTDALVIGLLAAGVSAGDEVITTPFTFFATAEAISQIGATPVFVDVDIRTYNINLEQLEAAITPRTKAIIPVHLFGLAVDMDNVMKIAREHGLIVVEDTAQAFGAESGGKKAGTFGDVGCYSFFPSKNLGAYGDGGLLVTDNDEIAEKAEMLRAHGSKKKYHNEIVGYNSRLDEIQAAILRIKLPHIDQWNEGRQQAANHYHQLLEGNKNLILPVYEETGNSVFHQYTVRITGGKRDDVQRKLAEAGIQTMIYYPIPVHQLPIYRGMNRSLPNAETLAGEVLSLPIWPHIKPEIQEAVVVQLLRSM